MHTERPKTANTVTLNVTAYTQVCGSKSSTSFKIISKTSVKWNEVMVEMFQIKLFEDFHQFLSYSHRSELQV